MKITLLNTTDAGGGAAIACMRLAAALHQQKTAIRVVVNKQQTDTPYVINASKGLQKGISFFNEWLERLCFVREESSKSIRFAFSLANTGQNITKIKAVQDADILHLHWINKGFLSLKNLEQLAQLNKPIVWTLHDEWAFTGGCHYTKGCTNYQTGCGNCWYLKKPHPKDTSSKIWQRKQQLYAKLQPTIITCSQWLQHEAKQSTLLKPFEVHTIPNPIDNTRYQKLDKIAIRKKWKLPLDKKLILFIAGNVHVPRKGLRFLVDAFRVLKTQHRSFFKEVELLLVGKSKADIVNQFDFPTHQIGLVHEQDKVIELYNASDVFVIPSLEDNLPNTVMESLACGTPVIGFETGGIPEMITHQYNGYLVPQKDVTGLANGLIWTLKDPIRYQQLAQNALEKVKIAYAYTRVAQQHLALYRSLLKGNLGGGRG